MLSPPRFAARSRALVAALFAAFSLALAAPGVAGAQVTAPTSSTGGGSTPSGGGPSSTLTQAPIGRQPVSLQQVATALMAQNPIGPNTVPISLGAQGVGAVTATPIPIQSNSLPSFVPGAGAYYLLFRIYVPATGRDELFLLYVPTAPASQLRPLLVAFHSYDRSHQEIETATSYIAEAAAREWYLIAPLQAGGNGLFDVNFGSADSQEHVSAVLRWVRRRYPIDLDRVYGVGFSMGGGSAMSYGARHRDLDEGAFAAIVNHTGTVSLSDTYANVSFPTQLEMIALFGNSPSGAPFEYLRSSSIELGTMGVLVPGGRHMAVNLEHVPVMTIFGLTDPNQYLVHQCMQLDLFMQGLPAANHTLLPQTVPSTQACNSSAHCWDTADETMVCDWLELHQLERSLAAGTVLADRDGRWQHFDVVQEVPDEFTRFTYDVDVAANRVTIHETENLRRIGLDPADLGLDPQTSMEVEIASIDGTEDGLALSGYPTTPLLVLRNGFQVSPSCTPTAGNSTWCFDPATQAVMLHEVGPGIATWVILP